MGGLTGVEVDMEEQTRANDKPILYEHEWVEELRKLATKAGDKDIYVEYSFPAGSLFATGFQLQVDGRTIQIPLQRESPSGLANAYLQLFLPEEESAHYKKQVSTEGEIFLSVKYPYCDHNFRPDVALAEIRISTSAELLNLVTSEAQRQ